ncbi:MAG: pyridoxine 5'-phosphate synthase [Zetaproteobacteria bacterium CG12_big_fil_rev_8_21_14_0_65_55_1124]|nr:MAG: pyridoxine 5'-phosphate synthase [Zetaproteobacteria bacterium CG1_02_55_237]PIS18923.1 MAG: pyridoxine 5'-phosphate synthase [Zetaproteobacteria bacterium CG08_land_8_20_14_0_20_55_17]PIW42186.1 MAG: pyridoxine 5'-phosphate synthase [Zetaproteobacteria bacterium CG12_big_fil_rev_8_21_14_0_65_55_1124]PIY54333.1 MAG: pyridoxine 5'-phosphate synthase [Zetaproteobacteria bacterium CG_4_10_14_0_8_um_filter_55_43]PIZ38876.1 MAG: pyridoxine 5'-phosphate synthase [Zetaproteobacteria bacterium 
MHLGVNIDHIATLRQARKTTYPDPVAAVGLCLAGGADGITAHLREDRRHIVDDDMHRLAEMPGLHLNMEMAASNEMVAICCKLKPLAACLVPEKREELTTEGGLDVAAHQARLASVVACLTEAGSRVSMFIDPDAAQVKASHAIGAPVIELHTGHYANLSGTAQREELARIVAAAKLAADLGLIVHAGHGLTLENTPAIVAIREIEGLNIGHAIVADAVFKGLECAVRDFKDVMRR